jgi:DNA repair protein RecO (recombination protein O)
VKGLVLKKIPFGESDLIVRFLIDTGEVVSAFAAGGRKSKKRFPHQFDCTGLYELSWTTEDAKKKLSHLQRCELLEYHAALATSLESFCRWAIVLEWIALDEGHDFEFEEIANLRRQLTETRLPYFLFFVGQMRIHGFHPEVERCLHCQKPMESEARFNFHEGGVVHAKCGSGVAISKNSLRFLAEILRGEIPEVAGEQELLALDEIILPFLEWQLGRSLKAQKVFAETFAGTLRVAQEQ